jgi:hypothetical protein
VITRRVERIPARVKSITISWEPGNYYVLTLPDGRRAELAWDEMLGTVAELTHRRLGESRLAFTTEREDRHRLNALYHGPLLLTYRPHIALEDLTGLEVQCPI